MSIHKNLIYSAGQLADGKYAFKLPRYPIDISLFLALPEITLDATGVPHNAKPAGYHPATIAQYALNHWNQYLTTSDECHREAFLVQANWLVEHEIDIGDDAGGWPNSFSFPDIITKGSWLSASTQGNGISILLRAYQLTHEAPFLEAACRAVRTFERDILDGGVTTPVGSGGIFFEEVAVYPAAHMLNGFIFALIGLYDYVALTNDAQIEKLIERSLKTIHSLLDEFDAGFWTRGDLLHRQLASPSHLALQVALLKALARLSGCEHCLILASRWSGYQHRISSRLRYLIASRCASYRDALWNHIRSRHFPSVLDAGVMRVCVPVYGFPVMGGIRAVLAGVDQAMTDKWDIEYLTQYVPPHSGEHVIHRFGTRRMAPWQFPAAWLYVLAGFRKLTLLLHRGASYHVILPQDGVYTAAFSALAAKLAGVRVVCIDHGNLTLVKNHTYRTECIKAITTKDWSWARRLFARLRYVLYWPSLYLFAKVAIRFVDHFLIPGVVGDGVEESCKQLGLHPSRITRFASMIDIDRHVVTDAASRASIRVEKGIAADTIVISLICRLAPEKGIDIALEAISLAFLELPPGICERIRIIIAGDGSLRKHVEEEINRRGLSQNCVLWGETSAADVITLLGLTDVFLYTSTRGACFSMGVLEAMASGCAVIASTAPMSNAHLLAEGRGIAVSPGDGEQTARALVRLLKDLELCRQMGRLAREYIAMQHGPVMFRRTLMRATYWSALDEILSLKMESER